MADWSKKNLSEVDDAAKRFGFSDIGEAHFAANELEATQTGLAYHVLKPGMRQGFGHSHERAEELHVVLAGSGRVRLDDEEVELAPLDALRVGPSVKRRFEAGPDGLAYVVFGPHVERDASMDREFWAD